jgi:hypothetical protein
MAKISIKIKKNFRKKLQNKRNLLKKIKIKKKLNSQKT